MAKKLRRISDEWGLAQITQKVCEKHGLKEYELWSELQWQDRVDARHEAFYEALANDYPAKVVDRIWGYSHTTILHGAARHAFITGKPPVTKFDYKRHRARKTQYETKRKEARRAETV